MLYRLGAEKPERVESWGWGYEFGGNGEGVYGFKTSDDGARILVMHDERCAETYQVAVQREEQRAEGGAARVLPRQGRWTRRVRGRRPHPRPAST